MPKRSHRGNSSSFRFADPGVEDQDNWITEYEVEFRLKSGKEEQNSPLRQVESSQSLKKGFVHVTEYGKLEDTLCELKASHRFLEAHLGQSQEQMKILRDQEKNFRDGIKKEHKAVSKVKSNMSSLSNTLGSLMAAVENNHTLATHLENLHEEITPDEEKEAEPEARSELGTMNSRLAALEGQLGALTESMRNIATRVREESRAGKKQPEGKEAGYCRKYRFNMPEHNPRHHLSGPSNFKSYWVP